MIPDSLESVWSSLILWRVGEYGYRSFVSVSFERDGRLAAGCRVAARRVVPAIDELEERHPRLGFGRELAPCRDFALEGVAEALTHGFVVGIAHAAHGRTDADLLAPQVETYERILITFNRSSQQN